MITKTKSGDDIHSAIYKYLVNTILPSSEQPFVSRVLVNMNILQIIATK